MPELLAYMIFGFGVAILVGTLPRPGGYLKVPTLGAAMLLGWVGPQYYVLATDGGEASGGVTTLGIMVLACAAALVVGWHFGVNRSVSRRPVSDLPVAQLILPVAALTIFSGAMNYLVAAQPEDVRGQSQWTGQITIYAFFASLRTLALILSLLMFLRRRTNGTLMLLIANAAVSLPVAVVDLRRTEMALIGVTILGTLWFARRIQLPVIALAAAALAFAAVVFTIGPLRAASNEIFAETGQRPWIGSQEVLSRVNFESSINSSIEQAPDMRNAAALIEFVDLRNEHAFGGVAWDGFIHQWVPGQILGKEFKQSLMTGSRDLFARIEAGSAYDYQTGTTSTGFGSAYFDFNVFGAIYFGLFGFLAGYFYQRGMNGDPWDQSLYLTSATFILISLTHGHDFFIASLPLTFLTVMALKWMASLLLFGQQQRRRRSLNSPDVFRRQL